MAIFSRGFDNAKKNEEKQKQQSGSKIWRLFLKNDGDEAPLIFLNEQPVNFYEHAVQKKRNGKDYYENIICTGSDCDLCDDGNRPSPKSAWLVVDQREIEYTDSNGKKQTIENQIRLLVQGTKFASMCDRFSKKYGLTDREWTFVRMGKGKQTSYTLERGDELDIDLEAIQELLPNEFKDLYDGTEDSVMDIIEKVLMPVVEDEEDEDEDDGVLSSGDDDEEEEDEEPTRTKKLGKKKESKLKLGKKRGIKPVETKRKSVKDIIRERNKVCI